ncbi:MAG: thioredoxin domain-containing protein [Burkholderiales bacterium]|nr:hypothetical protein [Ferrovum sp.]
MSQNFGALLDKLVAVHGVVELGSDGFQIFMDAPGDGVVLLVEEPDKTPESWDLAVIFPDLLLATGNNLRPALLRSGQAASLQTRFGIKRLPALLFLRDGGYVGVIEGLRDWNDFVGECKAMQLAPLSRPPSIGIGVSPVTPSGCH